MSKVVKTEQCPRCAERGADRSKNNLAVYADDGAHCFACGYHRRGRFQLTFINKETPNVTEKAVLPGDFTRQVPTEGWQWLLQYGLPFSYWKDYCGYSPSANRLIITYGNPIRLSQGRALSVGDAKWTTYGDRGSFVGLIGEGVSEEIVLVEDLISAHKVGQVYSTIPLLGTNLADPVIRKLQELKRPVCLWQDGDQYSQLPKRMGRLQTLISTPVRYIRTDKDPKSYTTDEIKEILQ